jgi:hypothetical protein
MINHGVDPFDIECICRTTPELIRVEVMAGGFRNTIINYGVAPKYIL